MDGFFKFHMSWAEAANLYPGKLHWSDQVSIINSNELQHNQLGLLLSLVLICRRPTWDVAAGMAWDNAAACVNIYRRHIICRRHWSPACLRSWTQLNFAGKSVVNAWDRLCVGDKWSHMPQLSQVGRRHMRTSSQQKKGYRMVFASIWFASTS